MAQPLHQDVINAIAAAVTAAMTQLPAPQVTIQAPAAAPVIVHTDSTKPEKYKGEKGRELTRFLSQFEAYFITARVTDDKDKVMLALGRLSDKAAQ